MLPLPIGLPAMHPFVQTASVLGPLILGIMVLTVFFKFIGWLGRRLNGGPKSHSFRGILDEVTGATVHLSNGTTYENTRLIGFTDSDSFKGPFPYELRSMVILELPDGRRVIVQAKLIRMIEIPPAENSVKR